MDEARYNSYLIYCKNRGGARLSGENVYFASFTYHSPLQNMNIPLNIACDEGDLEKAKSLYVPGDEIYIAMAMAAQKGHLEVLKFILECETDPKDREKGLCQALFIASQNGHLETVAHLLQLGKPIVKKKERSALHAAASMGHVDITQMLLDAGIAVDFLDEDGCTPLWEAVTNSRIGTIRLLLERGANPRLEDDFGNSPYSLALQNNYAEALELMGL